jgi:hypothetical protein
VGRKDSETFSLALALVTPLAELEAWFADAAPHAKAIYAVGMVLPREEPAVVQVKRWIASGEVHPFQRRDPMDARRWQFLIERADTASARAREVRPDLSGQQLIVLHRELVNAAAADAPCPTRKALAQTVTGQSDERARDRVRWLMKRLEAEGKIALQPAPVGAQHGPTVTILTGKHAGKSTRRMV